MPENLPVGHLRATLPKTGILDNRQLLLRVLDEVKLLRDENERLKLRIAELESRLERYENPKNSGNSSVPPSRDPFRKTRSLRGKSKRRPDGQKGRKGKKLEMAEVPDKVVLHDIVRCTCCGSDLPKEAEGYDARQVFIHTANALEIGRSMARERLQKAA